MSGDGQVTSVTRTVECWVSEDAGVFHVINEITEKRRVRQSTFQSHDEAVSYMAEHPCL